MPPKSTQLRMEHFDEGIYSVEPSTILYRFIDAMCGDSGAGTLKKEIFLQRLSASLDGMYGNTLDYLFGSVRSISRSSAESYDYETDSASLTSVQWDEVEVKDAEFRSKIKEFFMAAQKGATAEGIRQVVHAVTSSDCQVIESWRYIDSFGISEGVGRSLVTAYAAVDLSSGHRVYFTDDDPEEALAQAEAFVFNKPDWEIEEMRPRNELTVVPHKLTYSSRESRNLQQMLDKITPQDCIVTISSEGLATNTPVTIRAVSADSSYFQVEKTVTATPEIDKLPAPELLAIDLDPTEKWLFSKSPELAPYARFNITQEYGYYYLVSGGDRSPIDTVTYGILQDDGSVKPEPVMEWYEESEQYGPWTSYEVTTNPAYASQEEYVAARKAEVIALGGQADEYRYRLPIEKPVSFKKVYTADLAVASVAPTRESTVTSSWTSRRQKSFFGELRNPASFVR